MVSKTDPETGTGTNPRPNPKPGGAVEPKKPFPYAKVLSIVVIVGVAAYMLWAS